MDLQTTRVINSLPPEVLKRALDFLSIEDKQNARLVCQIWRYIIDEFGWPKSVAFRLYLHGGNQDDEDIQRFLKSDRILDKVHVKDCSIWMSMLPHKARRFPVIEGTVIIGHYNDQGAVVNFLKYGCLYANALILEDFCFRHTRRYVISGLLRKDFIGFQNFTKLTIEVYTPSNEWDTELKKNHAKSCSTFLKHAKIPKLRELAYKNHPYEAVPGYRLLYKRTLGNLIGFIARHSTTLKILSYNFTHHWNIEFDWSAIPQDLSLESCTIQTTYFIPPNQSYVPRIITASGLKSLKIECINYGIPVDPLGLHGAAIKQILEANSNTLENVDLELSYLDTNWFHPCTKLKSLKLWTSYNNINDQTEPNVSRPYHLPYLTQVNLNIYHYNRNPFLLGYETLLISCGTSITHLTIGMYGRHRVYEINDWKWLNSCVNLEYLCLEDSVIDLGTVGGNQVFPRLKVLRVPRIGDSLIYILKSVNSVKWIASRMPNLKIILLTRDVNLSDLTLLFAFTQLKEVHFSYPGPSSVAIHLIETFYTSEDMVNSFRLVIKPGLYQVSRVRARN